MSNHSVFDNERCESCSQYPIIYAESLASDQLKKIEYFRAVSHYADAEVRRVVRVVQATNPLCVPMTWSMYPERVWAAGYSSDAVSCLRISSLRNNLETTKCIYMSDRASSIEMVTDGSISIHVSCEPSWQTYHRWSTALMDSFTRGMRAVRDEYGIDHWTDRSDLKSTYGDPVIKYECKGASVLRIPAKNPVRRGSTIFDTHTLSVDIVFRHTMPYNPDGAPGGFPAACRVVEEVVTETKTRVVRRLSCEGEK